MRTAGLLVLAMLAGCSAQPVVDDATNAPQRGMWRVTTRTTGASPARLRQDVMPPLEAALCIEPHLSDPDWLAPQLSRQLSRPCKVETTFSERDVLTGAGFCTAYAPFTLTGSATRNVVHAEAAFDEGEAFVVAIDAVRTGDCRG